jgi:hypothetical protein
VPLIQCCGVEQTSEFDLRVDVWLECRRSFWNDEWQRGCRDKPAADCIPIKPKQGVVFDVPTGRKRTLAGEEGAYLLCRDIGNIEFLSHGSAKRFQQAPVGSESLAKRFSKSGVLFNDALEVQSRPPRSKLATSRSRTRSTFA